MSVVPEPHSFNPLEAKPGSAPALPRPRERTYAAFHGSDRDFDKFAAAEYGSGALSGHFAKLPEPVAAYLTSEKGHAAQYGEPREFVIKAALKHHDAAKELRRWAKEIGYKSAQDMIDKHFDGDAYQALDADSYFTNAMRDAAATGHHGIAVNFGDLQNTFDRKKVPLGTIYGVTALDKIARVKEAA